MQKDKVLGIFEEMTNIRFSWTTNDLQVCPKFMFPQHCCVSEKNRDFTKAKQSSHICI